MVAGAPVAAGIHDDAGAFLGLDEMPAGVRAIELQHEVIEVARLFEQVGGVGFNLLEPRAPVHYLAPRRAHQGGEPGDGRTEGGGARRGHAPVGRAVSPV